MSTFKKTLPKFVAEAEVKAEEFLAIIDPAVNSLREFIGGYADNLTDSEKKELKKALVTKLEEVLRANIAAGKYTCLQGLNGLLDNKAIMMVIRSLLNK